ncbi:MAG: LptA/OstA family protein, partial [Pseudomonadota bacterium]
MTGGSTVAVQRWLRQPLQRLRGTTALAATLLALVLVAAPLHAQETQPSPQLDEDERAPQNDTALQENAGDRTDLIDFEADQIAYDNEGETVTARGNVILRSEDRSVRADEVVWNQQSGTIIATGTIRFVDERGNQLFTDQLELSDTFEVGAMRELLLALRAGGRLAAREGTRGEDGTVILTDAAYTACAVSDEAGCDKDPSWRITADRVTYDQNAQRVRFRGAMLELFGARILPLPGLALRTDGGAASGFLVPNPRFSQVNGLELNAEYYWRLANNKDLTLGAFVFTDVAPMASAEWRHLTERGAYQITGYATVSSRVADFTGVPTTESDPRGYLFSNGRFQFSPEWSATGSIR